MKGNEEGRRNERNLSDWAHVTRNKQTQNFEKASNINRGGKTQGRERKKTKQNSKKNKCKRSYTHEDNVLAVLLQLRNDVVLADLRGIEVVSDVDESGQSSCGEPFQSLHCHCGRVGNEAIQSRGSGLLVQILLEHGQFVLVWERKRVGVTSARRRRQPANLPRIHWRGERFVELGEVIAQSIDQQNDRFGELGSGPATSGEEKAQPRVMRKSGNRANRVPEGRCETGASSQDEFNGSS